MANGTVVAICISPIAGRPMQSLEQVEAIAGLGLAGDRYALGEGSFNGGHPGKRQVTLINDLFVHGSGFNYLQTRRNIVVEDIEFQIDDVVLRGIKYCDPCMRPSSLIDTHKSFRANFYDRGGLVADIIKGGPIKVGSIVIPRRKGY